MALSQLQELEREAVMGTYARNPVEFVRGDGAKLLRALAKSLNGGGR